MNKFIWFPGAVSVIPSTLLPLRDTILSLSLSVPYMCVCVRACVRASVYLCIYIYADVKPPPFILIVPRSPRSS